MAIALAVVVYVVHLPVLCVSWNVPVAPLGALTTPRTAARARGWEWEPAAMHGGRVFWFVKYKEGAM